MPPARFGHYLTNPSAANCKGRITKFFEPMHKHKILSLKIDGLCLFLYLYISNHVILKLIIFEE